MRCLIFLLLLLSYHVNAQSLRIYHIDVEQGDSTLFVSPNGNTLLVDSGKNGHGPRIKAIMTQAGVNRIDHFVATHYHEDHFGGIDDLASDPEITIVNSYDRGDKLFLPQNKLNEETYIDYENAVGKNADQLTRGETIPLDPEMQVLCVAAGGTVLGEVHEVHAGHENDMSIVLLIKYGNFRYFIGGDIEVTTEGKLADRDLVLDVDVYQANHHGSHTSSSLAFMQDMSPTLIVISNGNHGNHQHPRKHTLNTYENLTPVPIVLQTNKYFKGKQGGNVEDEFIADLETSDQDGTILINVDKTSSSYTVSYRDKSLSFNIKNTTSLSSSIVIESVLPNPAGNDRKNEKINILNKGSTSINLNGWVIRDDRGKVWSLNSLGDISGGQSKTIVRNGMPMSLHNSGDEIILLNSSGQE